MKLFPIRDDEDHSRALREIADHWDAPEGSDEEAYMDALATLVDAYERKQHPIPSVAPLEVIQFMMEQGGRTQKDLAELLGSRSRASELLHGKRELTLDQIRLLAGRWHIPAGALIGKLERA
jgi:HTH-type transcriptional regulator/antitoxin HigA